MNTKRNLFILTFMILFSLALTAKKLPLMPKFKCYSSGVVAKTDGKGKLSVVLDGKSVFSGQVTYSDPAAVSTFKSTDGLWRLSVNPVGPKKYDGLLTGPAVLLPGGSKTLLCK